MTDGAGSLPHFLSGERREIDVPGAGLVSYYADGPDSIDDATLSPANQIPLLLVHSINAAASAHEVKPLYDFYRTRRRVYAIDLPGYGHSERGDRPYVPRLMVNAIHALMTRIRSDTDDRAIDGLAASLSCEFLVRAAMEAPDAFRSLALVSPTGFRRRSPTAAPPESNRGSRMALRILTLPLFGRALFGLLTTAPSIRYFLQKTWGSKQIDEDMLRNSVRTARQPGARHAPFHFLSGYLSSADILEVYASVRADVWMAHGVRGDFTDYFRSDEVACKANWRITQFPTGALPYFEMPGKFIEDYDDFLARVAEPGQATRDSGDGETSEN